MVQGLLCKISGKHSSHVLFWSLDWLQHPLITWPALFLLPASISLQQHVQLVSSSLLLGLRKLIIWESAIMLASLASPSFKVASWDLSLDPVIISIGMMIPVACHQPVNESPRCSDPIPLPPLYDLVGAPLVSASSSSGHFRFLQAALKSRVQAGCVISKLGYFFTPGGGRPDGQKIYSDLKSALILNFCLISDNTGWVKVMRRAHSSQLSH